MKENITLTTHKSKHRAPLPNINLNNNPINYPHYQLTAFLSHFSAFIEASAAGIFLAKQHIKAHVCSAALNVFPLGVLKQIKALTKRKNKNNHLRREKHNK